MLSSAVRILILLVLVLMSVACSLPGLSGAGMPDDGPPIAVSEEAAASLEQKVAEAAQTTGPATVTVTQEEVTSYLALRLAAQSAAQGVENPLQEPQVYFKENGTIVLRAHVLFQERSQPIRVVARPSAVDGALAVDIIEGRIGPVPVPGPLLDQVEGQLASAILAGQQYSRLDQVEVGPGTLSVTGERQ